MCVWPKLNRIVADRKKKIKCEHTLLLWNIFKMSLLLVFHSHHSSLHSTHPHNRALGRNWIKKTVLRGASKITENVLVLGVFEKGNESGNLIENCPKLNGIRDLFSSSRTRELFNFQNMRFDRFLPLNVSQFTRKKRIFY